MEKDTTPELTGPLPPRAYLRLCAREPYRVLFPIGTVFGLLGVAVWPLAALGWAPSPPAQNHPRLLIEGFFGTFLIGFLASSLPRLLGVEPLGGNLVIILSSTLLSVGMFHLLGGQWLGDLLFSFALALLLIGFALRFRDRKAVPPPSFLLVLLGAVEGAAGAFLQAEKAMGMRSGPLLQQVSHLLLFQGLPLLSLLGAAAFFAPRIYGGESREADPPGRRPSGAWLRLVLTAAGAGLLIFASFLLEAGGMRLPGGLLRVSTAVGYLALTLPVSAELLTRGTVYSASRLALAFAMLGLLLSPFLPPARAGSLHLFFLGGVGLLTLAAGIQLVYGLSGRAFLLRFRFLPFEYAIGGVVAALVARIAADHYPSWRSPLLSLSALCWIGTVVLWALSVLPFVLCPESEEGREGKEGREG